MTLKPLPPAAKTVARMRQIAHEILLEADALEATYQVYKPTKHYEFRHSKKNREERR